MKKEAIAFDIDGLLVDSEGLYTKAWQIALSELGIELSDDEVKRFGGLNWRMVRKQLEEAYGTTIADQAVLKREEILIAQIEAGKMQPKPEAEATLKWARAEGYRLAVVSSGKKARAHRILEKLNWLDNFEFCIFGDDVANHKPHPEPYEKAIKQFGLPKEVVLAVEDSLVGATAASRAGLDVMLIPDTTLHPNGYSKEEVASLKLFGVDRTLAGLRQQLINTKTEIEGEL